MYPNNEGYENDLMLTMKRLFYIVFFFPEVQFVSKCEIIITWDYTNVLIDKWLSLSVSCSILHLQEG